MTDTVIDFDAVYKVEGHGGIAWRAVRYATEEVEVPFEYEYDPGIDGEEGDPYIVTEYQWENVENREQVECYMVGDDSIWTFDISDLTPIGEDDYCPSCGQIGCGWH